uniref:Cytochrome P450 n=1 Tax=Nothapodytes nimmoniana TaxID=159386 RepID=A0A7L7RBB6_NOTNI|nr:cytochrome P450 [Nothapodytes nimmoniana]
MIYFLISYLFLFLLLVLIRFIYKVVWTPNYITYVLRSQGINGPSYKFIHGNSKEIIEMKHKCISCPMDLSHDVFPRILPHIHLWIKLYGKKFLAWYGPKPQMFVTEPELIKEILNNNDGSFIKIKSEGYVKKLLGDGIFVTDGDKWSKLRKLANHAFHAESLREMVPAMVTAVEGMLERWRLIEGKEIEISQELKVLTSDVISITAFGSSFLEGKNIFEMLTNMGVIIFRNDSKVRLPILEKLYKTRDEAEADKIEQSLRESVIAIIRKREEEVMKGKAGNFGNDFLGSLMKLHHHDDKHRRISVDDMIDECKTFYLAGQETTSSLLNWTTLLLAIHTDWQEKARKEVLQLFGEENPNSEGLARSKTLNMIMNETLRLYSPVVDIVRRTEKKVTLGKIVLPANMEIHIPPPALHHDTELWGNDAHLFKPERFSEGVAKATNNNNIAFLPFGFGPRTCVGLNFATTEAKIAISMILQRYKFTLSPSYVHSPFVFLTVSPQQGIPIVFQPL